MLDGKTFICKGWEPGKGAVEKTVKVTGTLDGPENDHQWSHPLVYHAGKETGWFFLKNESEQNAFKEFSKSFDLVIHNWLEGKNYNSPEITRIEEAKPNLDKSIQLNLIKRLKDKF